MEIGYDNALARGQTAGKGKKEEGEREGRVHGTGG
jgi:hypothetical protein